jgi:hypothetical protein
VSFDGLVVDLLLITEFKVMEDKQSVTEYYVSNMESIKSMETVTILPFAAVEFPPHSPHAMHAQHSRLGTLTLIEKLSILQPSGV